MLQPPHAYPPDLLVFPPLFLDIESWRKNAHLPPPLLIDGPVGSLLVSHLSLRIILTELRRLRIFLSAL